MAEHSAPTPNYLPQPVAHISSKRVNAAWFYLMLSVLKVYTGSASFLRFVSVAPFRWFRWFRSGVPDFSACPNDSDLENEHILCEGQNFDGSTYSSTSHLHSDDGVHEEHQHDKKSDVRESLSTW